MDKTTDQHPRRKIESESDTQPPSGELAPEQGEGAETDLVEARRNLYLGILGILVPALICLSVSFIRYLRQPQPLPDLLLPELNLNYPPHYLFSIYGVEQPVGVGVSGRGDRLYAAESGGERLVRIFDRSGAPLGSLAPPKTGRGDRSPVYLAVDTLGRVFVSDRLQHGVLLFDKEGRYIDTLLGPVTSLSEIVAEHTDIPMAGTTMAANLVLNMAYLQPAGQEEAAFSLDGVPNWSPLGVRLGPEGSNLYLTDVSKGHNCVWIIDIGSMPEATRWTEYSPAAAAFGSSGVEAGEFLFPNVAMADSVGRTYVSDGNNGRISVWSAEGEFLYHLGLGTGEGSLSVPRGLMVDRRDRLHVVDAVSQQVVVYDVSGEEPEFLFHFGGFGVEAGQFNFPNDIAIDQTGRLYIADRENDRIQVWGY